MITYSRLPHQCTVSEELELENTWKTAPKAASLARFSDLAFKLIDKVFTIVENSIYHVVCLFQHHDYSTQLGF